MWGNYWNTNGWGGQQTGASACATKSYHNGGVEGRAFANWYDTHLSDHFGDQNHDGNGSDGTKGSETGGTKASGSGGTKGSESGGTKGLHATQMTSRC